MQSSVPFSEPPPDGVLVQHRVPGFSEDWVISEQPVPEAAWHDIALELLKALLVNWVCRTAQDAWVFRNIAIRVRQDKPSVGINPDLALVAPAPPQAHELSCLRLWEPGHAVPALVVEVVSPDHPTKDYTQTPDQCAALGVRELVVFDPMLAGPKSLGNAQRLHVWRRSEAGAFERMHCGDGPFGSEVLGAQLMVTEDRRKLRIAEDAEGLRLWQTETEMEREAAQAARREREAAQREREAAQRERETVQRECEAAQREREEKERVLARVRELEAQLEKRRG